MTKPTDKPQVIVIVSYQYLNLQNLYSNLESVSNSVFHIASKNGLGHVLLKSPKNLKVQSILWHPTDSNSSHSANPNKYPFNPALLKQCTDLGVTSAMLFWDGTDQTFLPSVRFFEHAKIPFRIIGPNTKDVAASAFHATFSKGDTDMSARPQVIVDGPPSPDVRVRMQLNLPESIVTAYEQQARLVKLPVEKIMSDRLRSCVEHTSGRGLYFNDVQRSAIERITGGHLIMNSEDALQKIKTTVNLKVNDITIEVSERILARCASRAKAERKSFEAYVKQEVLQGLERSVGLRPW